MSSICFSLMLLSANFILLEGYKHYVTASKSPRDFYASSSDYLGTHGQAYPDGIQFTAVGYSDVVVLVFTKLRMDEGCSQHYINVYDGMSSSDTLLKHVCWDDFNITVVSTGSDLFVTYTVTDHSSWFKVTYSSRQKRSQSSSAGQLNSLAIGGIGAAVGISVVVMVCVAICYFYSKRKRRSTPYYPVDMSGYPTARDSGVATTVHPLRTNTTVNPTSNVYSISNNMPSPSQGAYNPPMPSAAVYSPPAPPAAAYYPPAPPAAAYPPPVPSSAYTPPSSAYPTPSTAYSSAPPTAFTPSSADFLQSPSSAFSQEWSSAFSNPAPSNASYFTYSSPADNKVGLESSHLPHTSGRSDPSAPPASPPPYQEATTWGF